MKRLFFIIIILLFCGVPHAAASLLYGQTPSSYSLPAGWSLVTKQDFEGTQPANESWGGASGSVTTTKPHGGVGKSIEGTYDGDQDQVRWALREGYTGNFTEIYYSFYEWVDADARFNDEYYLGRFEVTNPFAEIVMEAAYWSPGFNTTSSNVYFTCQGTSGDCPATYVAFHDPAEGAWVQWEIHFKPNTSGQSDGFLRFYKNGTLLGAKENYVLNNTRSFNNARVEAGGVYTKVAWMTGYPPNCPTSSCSSAPGVGTDYCYAAYFRYQSFSSPACAPIDPPLSSFKRYIDDIIVMKYSGPGIDTDPPSINNRSPDSGATNWPVATDTVSFTLNDPSGVDSSTLNFNMGGGTTKTCSSGLSCSPSGDPTSLNVVYTRGSPWEYSTTYTAYITSVYDLAGNQQVSNWQFTTEAAPPSDTTAPTLASSTPPDGQTDWPIDWYLSFDIEDPGGVDSSTLQFNINGGATLTCGNGLTCIYPVPTSYLRAFYYLVSSGGTHPHWACGTTYTANIPQVKDTAGNSLNTSWTFSTVGCQEVGPGPGGDFIIHIHED